MADVNANINIDIDSSDAVASLKSLQSRITEFNNAVIRSNASAVAAQKSLLSTLNAQIGVAGQFSTSMVNVESSVNRLGTAIDKNKLSLGEYFRYGAASTRTFGRFFAKEHNDVMDLAADRVKRLQTQYIALEKSQSGATKAMAIRPMHLFNSDAAVAIQRQQLFNKLLHDGSTSLINFGKNTQWAGRQLMVGFSVPLAAFGVAASKTFMDLDRQARDFKRVYGDIFTPPEEVSQNLKAIQDLGKEYTKYGVALSDTMNIGATAAAAGMRNEKLTKNTEQALRLATVGQIDYQQALTTTITLQNAFKISNDQLAPTVDFIGAVANQTVLSVDDLTAAIPRVAPVIQGLGGDVKDLAVMLVAMKEGGVSAEQGANALKSGLASLINPTKAAIKTTAQFGINIKGIVEANKGDLMGTVEAFGAALSKLDQFSRQQVLEKVFGKYQFARIGALFDNINNKTGQVKQSMDLLGMSTQDLAAMSDKSLNQIAESTTAKFESAVEKLKIAIAPIGEIFLKVATPILEFATKLLDKFNELSPGVKQFITILTIGLGVVVPAVIMLVGLFANFAGNMIKGLSLVNTFFNRIKSGGSVFKYMSGEELDAAAAASSLEGKTNRLTSALNVQREAVMSLSGAYGSYVRAANSAAGSLPQGFRSPRRMATGGFVAGTGNKDSEPALLMPGEFVVNKPAAQKYGPILGAMNSGTIKGYSRGSNDQFAHIGSKLSIGSSDLFNIMQSLPEAFGKGAFNLVKAISSVFGNSLKSILLPSLGFMTTGNINRRLDRPGKNPVTKEEFLADWDKRGIQRWKESLRRAGIKLEDVSGDLTMLDSSMRSRISSLEKNQTIDDKIMKKIYDESIKLIPSTSRLKTSFDLLSQTYKEIRTNVSQTMLNEKSIETFSMGTKRGASVGGKTIRVGGDRADYTILGTGIKKETLLAAKTGKELGNIGGKNFATSFGEAGQLAIANAIQKRRKSPDPIIPIAGNQDGQGWATAFQARVQQILSKSTQGASSPVVAGIPGPAPLEQEGKKTGGVLKGMRGKLMGASAGITALTMGLSFMNNGVGQMAQQIMPFTFVLDAAIGAMGLMSSSMLVAVAPVAAIALAIGGLAIAAKILTDKQNEAVKKTQQYIDAQQGAAGSMTSLAKQTGKKGIIERNIAAQVTYKPTEKQKTFAENFTAGEAGKQIVSSVGSLSGEERITSLKNQLLQGIAGGFLSPAQAKAVAQQVSVQLNDPIIGNSVVASINNALTKNGKSLRDTVSSVFAGTIIDLSKNPQIAQTQGKIAAAAARAAEIKNLPAGSNIIVPATPAIGKEEGARSFQLAATNAIKLKEAMGLLNEDLSKGNITQEEYKKRQKELSSRFQENLKFIEELKNAVGGGNDTVGGYFLNLAESMGKTEDQFKTTEGNIRDLIGALKDVPKDTENRLKLEYASGSLTEEDLANIKALIETVPEEKKAEFNYVLNKNGWTPESIKLINSIKDMPDNQRKKVEAVFLTKGIDAANNLITALSLLGQIPPKKRIDVETFLLGASAKDVEDMSLYLQNIGNVKNKKIFIDAIVAYSIDANSIDNVTNQINSNMDLAAKQLGHGSSAITTLKNIDTGSKIIADAKKDQKKQKGILDQGMKTVQKNNDNGNNDGVGGSGNKSWLQQQIDDANATAQMFPKLMNQLKNKFPNVPKGILDAIGTGEEGLKNLNALLNGNSKKIAAFFKTYTKNTIGESARAIQEEIDSNNEKVTMVSALKSAGYNDTQIQTALATDAFVKEFKAMGITATNAGILKDKLVQLSNAQKAAAEATMSAEQRLQSYTETINNAIAKKEMEIRNDNAAQFLATNGMTTDQMHHQIDANNRIIQQEQDKINAKQSQIDALNRENELNNRVSDALTHDLDIMSQKEQTIKDTYQKRIDALNKVVEINNEIMQQQQGQIDLSKALSEGDVYAAAKAEQQMQQQHIQFAEKQQQDAMQAGMQNAIDNLKTPSGLTRKQAEQQINAAKEQSYQIELRIRKIQDEIYTIQNGQMKTLQDQNEQYSRKLEYNQQDLDWQIATTDFYGHSISYWKNYLSDLAIASKRTEDLADAIRKLNAEFGNLLNKSGGSGVANAGSQGNGTLNPSTGIITYPNGSVESSGSGDIGSHFGPGVVYPPGTTFTGGPNGDAPAFVMATGGMVPRRYASGGHVGMDSVPAMLTPGEFVMRKSAVNRYGKGTLSDMNTGRFNIPKPSRASSPSFKMPTYDTSKMYAGGTPNFNEMTSKNNNSTTHAPVYNTYSVSVPVSQPGASADDIANKVMMKIKSIDSNSIRRVNGY